MKQKMQKKPNIIFILTDDQGIWAAGCYGNPEIRTPNIDRLAKEGMRFANFFVATPVCSPSRATFLTGRIPSQHGVHDYIKEGNIGPDAIPYIKGETTYTDIMARNGWTCGINGKWHLGDNQIPQHGFTDWFVHQQNGSYYNDPPMVNNGQCVNIPGYSSDIFTNEALRLLEKYASGEYPFYLSVHYTAPHSPWTGHPKEIVDSYDDCSFKSCPQEPIHPWAKDQSLTGTCLGNKEMLKGYFAAVTAMDMNVGRILDRVDELGLRDNSLIIFTSDNGFSCGHHGFWGKGNGTKPLNLYENSIKVPAIFSHPGRIPEGVVEDAMVSAYDFMPTLLGYLGLPQPQEGNRPGKSFSKILLGKEKKDERKEVVIFDEYGSVRMIRTKDWKYVYRNPEGPNELYDLINDPDERENKIDDPSQKERICRMKEDMDRWFKKYVDPSRDGFKFTVTGDGQLEYLKKMV